MITYSHQDFTKNLKVEYTVINMFSGMREHMDKLYGVYNADGGIIGELADVIGKLRGKVHCALCDITHKGVAKKKEWKVLERALDIPLELVHLNEQKKELREYTHGKSPCVVGEINDDLIMILTSEELEGCKKSVKKFENMLNKSLQNLN